MQKKRKRKKGRGRGFDDGTYGIKRALPVVGDVGLAFRRFLEDPFVTLIRCHLSHQPASKSNRLSKSFSKAQYNEVTQTTKQHNTNPRLGTLSFFNYSLCKLVEGRSN